MAAVSATEFTGSASTTPKTHHGLPVIALGGKHERDRLARLAPQLQSAKQLRVCSNDDGRSAHRHGTDAHGEIKPPTDQKTSRNRNGEHVVGGRPNEILDHLSVTSA